MTRSLVVRLDNAGDVVLTGPATRALAASSDRVTFLCGPRGRAAAEMLPGVDDVIEFSAPWIDGHSVPVDADDCVRIVESIGRMRIDRAAVLTSFHQSPLPAALLLRLAGVAEIAGISVDHPGSLLDHRVAIDEGRHEVERNLGVVAALGASPPSDDDGRLALDVPTTAPSRALAIRQEGRRVVVLCPGATVPARRWSVDGFRELARLLVDRDVAVIVCGAPDERELTRQVARASAAVHDLGGSTSFGEFAALLGAVADVVVTGNSGPVHVAAAMGVPVVRIHAPTVPAATWRPWGVDHALLGRQSIDCAGCRAIECPVPGHPCIDGLEPLTVALAVEELLARERELVR